MIEFCDGPALGQRLRLRRAPLLLRAVFDRAKKTWDALDQTTDQPEPGEDIHVYRLWEEPTRMHVRPGGMMLMANYFSNPVQPADEVLRDQLKWQQWALAQDHRYHRDLLRLNPADSPAYAIAANLESLFLKHENAVLYRAFRQMLERYLQQLEGDDQREEKAAVCAINDLKAAAATIEARLRPRSLYRFSVELFGCGGEIYRVMNGGDWLDPVLTADEKIGTVLHACGQGMECEGKPVDRYAELQFMFEPIVPTADLLFHYVTTECDGESRCVDMGHGEQLWQYFESEAAIALSNGLAEQVRP